MTNVGGGRGVKMVGSQAWGCNKIIKMAAMASHCFPICLDTKDDIPKVKLMKTMMCDVTATHRNMLTDYLGTLPQQW